MNNRMVRAALWYVRQKWYVMPLHRPLFNGNGDCVGCTCEEWFRRKVKDYVCGTPGKHPMIRDWEDEASIDEDVIRGWWSKWPAANIGIAAGRSGLLVLDADSYKDTYQGEKLLTVSEEATVTGLTGSGGTHLVYAMPEGAYYTNRRGNLPAGIDIRGYGGQFVAPPSVHPSGRRYEWETGFGPHEMPLLPLPGHLCELLSGHNAVDGADVQFSEGQPDRPDLRSWRLSNKIVQFIEAAPEVGKRSETDQSVITALVAAGADDDQIRAVFVHFPIGVEGKFAEKGRNALRYLGHSIGHARVWYGRKQEEKRQERALAMMAMAVR